MKTTIIHREQYLHRAALAMGVVFCVVSSAQADIWGNLQRWYRFDEASGTNAADSSPSGVAGTLVNGAAFNATAMIGRSVLLDGTNDYVNAALVPQLDGATAATVACWIYTTSRSDFDLIFNKRVSDSANFGAGLGSTGVGGTDDVFFSCRNGSTASYGYTTANVVPLDNKWYHVAFVFNGGGVTNPARLKIYVDGDEKPVMFPGTIPATLMNSPSTPLLIGWRSDLLGGVSWQGRIDDFRIYNRALSQTEVAQLHTWRPPDPTGRTAAIGGAGITRDPIPQGF